MYKNTSQTPSQPYYPEITNKGVRNMNPVIREVISDFLSKTNKK